MKKLSIFAAILFAVVLGNNVNAQNNNSTASSTASAELITPIAITNEIPLNFGKIAKPAGVTGTVTITDDGNNTATYAPASMKTTLVTPTAAKFNITGDLNENFSVAIPSEIVLSKGDDNMTIDTDMNLSAANNTLDVSPKALYVGGTLNMAAQQPIGIYSATFDVTVTYE
jgi:hypothetical protein